MKLNFPDGFREALQYVVEWTASCQSWLLFICLFKECIQTVKDNLPPPPDTRVFGALCNVNGKAVPAHVLRAMGE